MSNDFTNLWSTTTKKKLKEQNSGRLTEPKNGLTATKGKGTEEDSGKGGIAVGKERGPYN